MGDFLKQSATAKSTYAAAFNQEEGDIVQFAVSRMKGRRKNQEDAYVIETELRAYDVIQNVSHEVLPGHALFAVFDGHGTSFASNYASMNFVSTFCKQQCFLEYSQKCLIDQQRPSNARKQKGKSDSQKKHHSSMNNEVFAKDDTGELRLLLEDAIKTTMIELDANMLEEMTNRKNHRENKSNTASCENDELYDEFDSGTTAIVLLLTPHYIVCANLGDCRAILQRGDEGSTLALSNDHKPYNELEEIRIRNAGGVVLSGNIEGRLGVSRGLGDFAFKHTPSVICAADIHNVKTKNIDAYIQPENQMVTAVPEITVLTREATHDKFLVIACDGIWDVVSNEKCAEMVSTIFNEGEQSVALACEEVLDQCYAKGSLDNMTAILVKCGSQEIGIGGGVMKRRKQRRYKGR
mmetsp:Transcript_15684/g.33959  ORF Transcript_15684/g.33959 Transcript_15684/m.33959 type:complete len:408 (+) Transcript_15684:219-1442(+)|eukprot:CAMPEP_0172331992 /NCGR_PEP_ID=MMETSP1058-20130122/62209_1 /TAXON_ID=83371 /ORGANISM="Detonula confervacea, Strain CCMP 353" /LENGTH=407 /DNA_ID=CAMNT_0013049269 /DNA_START=164 /DNA_END=1387 /DNA_ORIENTATION=+